MCYFFFFVSSVEAEITEIMYNSSGNDNNGEYVEIIFDEDTSMDGAGLKSLRFNILIK